VASVKVTTAPETASNVPGRLPLQTQKPGHRQAAAGGTQSSPVAVNRLTGYHAEGFTEGAASNVISTALYICEKESRL